jgi:ubiquinol-cytochrome c reductase core subunit 2
MKLTRAINQAARAVQAKGAAGLQAASVECDNGGAAHITVAIKAGSRYETSAGVAAMLAAGRSLSSLSHTSFLQNQQLAHAGATLSANNTRDHIVYTLTCGPKLIGEMFQDVVAPAIFKSEMWQWEIDNLERGLNNGQASSGCVVDKLHEVSFVGGLSTPSGVPAHRLGSGSMFKPDHTTDHSMYYVPTPQLDATRISTAEMCDHVAAHFKHGNISIFTSGMSASAHEMAAMTVRDYSNEGGASAAPASRFVSGEYRNNTSGPVSGCVGFPSAAAGAADQAAHNILAHAMGGQVHSYEGCGLMSIPTSDPAATVAKMASLSDADIQAAKEDCHANAAFAANTFAGAVGQALNGSSGSDYNVGVADIKALAGKLAKGKKSLAVSGDLSNCPFVSEL